MFQRKVFFNLYIFFNLLFSVFFIITGKLGGDFTSSDYNTNDYILICAFISVFFAFVLVLKILFPTIEDIRVTPLAENKTKFLDVIILAVALYNAYSISMGVGVNGIEKNDLQVSEFFKYIYAILQPSFLVLIYLFYRCNRVNNYYYITAMLYFSCSMISGESVNLLFLWPLLYLANRNKDKRKVKLNFITILVLGLIFYPLIRMSKFVILSVFLTGDSLTLSSMSDSYMRFADGGSFFEYYISMFSASFERFQVVANVQYLIENGTHIRNMYQYLPSDFFNEYFLTNFIYKLLTGINYSVTWLQSIVAYSINGNDSWNTHVSILGLGIVQGISSIPAYITMFFVFVFSILLSKKLATNVIELTWFLVLLLFIHGWFVSYVMFTQALVLFYIIVIVSNGFKLSAKYE
ncbi:TPA: oligosaccharide repeat unit polymerase [Escherichia coli]|nr:oligosaccharide repeat unit polymerase [Escherichia coli]